MSEEDETGGRFPLTFDDLEKLTRVIKLVRERLPKMNPACLHTAASVLLALERLPSTTPGVDVIFNFEQSNTDGNWGWADITISEDEFRLGLGQHFYEPLIGGDTETRVAFESYAGEEQSEGEIDDWLGIADVISRQGQVSIEQDNSDYDEIQWDVESEQDLAEQA